MVTDSKAYEALLQRRRSGGSKLFSERLGDKSIRKKVVMKDDGYMMVVAPKEGRR